jgi:hypothetical protein
MIHTYHKAGQIGLTTKTSRLEECHLPLSGFVLISAQWQAQGDDSVTRRVVVTLSSVVMFSVFYDLLPLSFARCFRGNQDIQVACSNIPK